ncbi:E3 ubiquitin/ISG15 ligase TRIM25-like [Anomaloglossus baeobatrachus]|uniref:E3 ubiquitin/ISG15 ligase TRIM25-like n=1 Tax=Anomaloglossus baeobatrachus TaxID=238106 RepID=UPI003F5093B4
MASSDLRDELSCSICRDIYTDPVSLICGHSFCRGCINRKLDSQSSKSYSCPDCGAEFRDRSKLCKNIVLAKVVECLPPIPPEKEETAIPCTYCFHSPVPAVKSCLLCEASLCERHLKVHSKSPEHVLSKPTNDQGNRRCSIHNKILEYYCLDDSTDVCVSCFVVGHHQGHNVKFLLDALETKKRQKLEQVLISKEKTNKELQHLKQRRRDVEDKASEMGKRVSSLFRDLRMKLNHFEMTALEVISKQEKKVLQTLADLIDHLEVKREELSGQIRDVEEMCKMSDPLTVLHEDFLHDVEHRNDEKLYEVEDIKDHEISLFLQTGLSDISAGTNVWIHMLKPVDLLLDVDTVSNNVTLSRDLKAIRHSYVDHSRPESAKRFDCSQALSIGVFSSGRHYWVVEISRSGNLGIGVCYPSICRNGYSLMGENENSWSLQYVINEWFVEHDRKATPLPDKVSSNRIGIYLDYDAGLLSFYDLTNPIRHLTTLKATFTEPLHAAFMVAKEGYIKILSDDL